MGIITKMLVWLDAPLTGDNNPKDWFYGFVLVVIVAFLWTQVLRKL